MGRLSALIALIGVTSAHSDGLTVKSGSCVNGNHWKFWAMPEWEKRQAIQTKLLGSGSSISCEFSECTSLFTNRNACNNIAVAYHPSMTDGTKADFTFGSNTRSSVPRYGFRESIFAPICDEFDAFNNVLPAGSKSSRINRLGPLGGRFTSKSNQLSRGDVLVYISNDYSSDDHVNDICTDLVAKGVIVLPIFVGESSATHVSHLSFLAESQKTLIQNFQSTKVWSQLNAKFGQLDTGGLILPAVDHVFSRASGAGGNLPGKSRREAIVMFARLFAQCPNSCLATCTSTAKSTNYPGVSFGPAPAGPVGCCGPVGVPGLRGVVGEQGNPGCVGLPGTGGGTGPPGPAGAPGPCGRVGRPGTTGGPGSKGSIGGPGVDGPNGTCGMRGRPGAPGRLGLPGGNGDRGNTGHPGGCGSNGETGGHGPQGPRGDTGVPGADGIGLIIARNTRDDFENVRDELIARAMLDIMDDDDIWTSVHNIEKQYNHELTNVPAYKSCHCDAVKSAKSSRVGH